MRIPRIFTPRAPTAGQVLELDDTASQHLARALRMKIGEPLLLFDGSGQEFTAEVAGIGKKAVTVTVGRARTVDRESSLAIQLGIGMSRGERMDWVVQKATELGVTAIAPLFTQRTEIKLSDERAEKKLRHWRQIAISACEQSGRARLPDILPPVDLGPWLADTQAERKFVLHHRATSQLTPGAAPASLALLVGPEGGLEDGEIAQAESAGFAALSLGPRVLRTETAPLAAIAILQGIWGDMAPGARTPEARTPEARTPGDS